MRIRFLQEQNAEPGPACSLPGSDSSLLREGPQRLRVCLVLPSPWWPSATLSWPTAKPGGNTGGKQRNLLRDQLLLWAEEWNLKIQLLRKSKNVGKDEGPMRKGGVVQVFLASETQTLQTFGPTSPCYPEHRVSFRCLVLIFPRSGKCIYPGQ